MKISSMPKTTINRKKRLGQGHGSGKVKTSGRGTKGQKARRNISLSFEGGALPLIKRLPYLRGKGRNKPLRKKAVIINVDKLNNLRKGAVVDLELLLKENIVAKEAKNYGVKILGDGVLSQSLNVKLPVSRAAARKIEKAGGKILTE